MDIDALAKQFSDYYYNTFDSDRRQLVSLYVRPLLTSRPNSQRENSLLTFEASKFVGAVGITEKLVV
jgi:hypothetical protein